LKNRHFITKKGLLMKSVFTPEDLLQYLYKETTPQQTAAIEQALAEDWTLREKLEVLKASYRRLEQFRLSPRKETVRNILRYAADTHTVHHLN
jgi:hypothetical protein